MKKSISFITVFLLPFFSMAAFCADPYTVFITQIDSTGQNQQTRFVARPDDDSFLKYDRSTDLPLWSSLSEITMSSTQIEDTTSVGRNVMTASDQAAARSAIGAGTSNFNGAYSGLTGQPTNLNQFTNGPGFITSATAPVTSVNGFTGGVTLTANGIGAASAMHNHPASQISDSTTIGRSLLTATDQASVKSIAGIPTAVGQLTNDSAYITSSALTGYATTSSLTNGLALKFNSPSCLTTQYLRGDGSCATFPAIPSAQVNSDWSASSGVAQILNKPVKYSGATNSSGIYAVTYASPYATVPHVVITVVGGTNKDSAVLTSTVNGFSILVERRSDVLGLLPTYAPVTPSSSPTATVNVTVTP